MLGTFLELRYLLKNIARSSLISYFAFLKFSVHYNYVDDWEFGYKFDCMYINENIFHLSIWPGRDNNRRLCLKRSHKSTTMNINLKFVKTYSRVYNHSLLSLLTIAKSVYDWEAAAKFSDDARRSIVLHSIQNFLRRMYSRF